MDFDPDPFSELAIRVGLVVMVLGLEDQARYEQERKNHRYYLTRSSLMPNPRYNTPWQCIYQGMSDRAFVITMGIDVNTFHLVLNGVRGFQFLWDTTPIFRTDTSLDGKVRLGGRSLDASGCLGLVLHYINSTLSEFSLQEIFAIVPAVCSRYIRFGFVLLKAALDNLPDARVGWPTPQSMDHYSELINTRHLLLEGAIGFVDGVHLPVECAGERDIENAYYNGWLSQHYTTNIFAFAPDGTLIFASFNAPGSWHDSHASRGLYRRLFDFTPDIYWLIADTAFPRTNERQKTKIKTPLKSGHHLPENSIEAERMQNFNNQLISARQAAEWGMRSIQGSFGRLKLPLPADDVVYREYLLHICCRLHQLRVRIVGVNQIRCVYEKTWQDMGNDIYHGFRNMLFEDIRRNDRIARFYQQGRA